MLPPFLFTQKQIVEGILRFIGHNLCHINGKMIKSQPFRKIIAYFLNDFLACFLAKTAYILGYKAERICLTLKYK